MKKQNLKKFESLLNRKIDRLIGAADRTVGRMSGGSTALPDPTDRASLEAERTIMLRIRDRERKLILKAREALLRIKNGTYGYCDSCGEPISKSRLEARPEASLCIECKNEIEDRERLAKSMRI